MSSDSKSLEHVDNAGSIAGLVSSSAAEQAGDKRFNVLSKFLSNTLLRDLVAGRAGLTPQSSHYQAGVLFADVSGFTNLTEKLMGKYGREQAVGAEHLTLMLSDYFDHLIAVVMAHDGDVIKFAGDAMLIMFPCSDVEPGLKRATSCGVEMQKVAKEVAARIHAQHQVVLSLKVAVSFGNITGLVLGGVLDRWEYAVLSDAIADVGRLGDVAESHDVLIGAKHLEVISQGQSEVKSELRNTDVFNVKDVPSWDLKIEKQPIQLAPSHEPTIRCFVPATVTSRIAAGQSDTNLLGELRRISVLFINLPDFASDTTVEQAQKIVATVQQACYGQRGSLDKISCDDKGVSIIAGFGVPPMSAEDDAIRAVKAAMNIERLLTSMKLSVSIGVATGPVYCGMLGDKYRCEYTLMGDGVNTAARLMSIANGSVLCDDVTVEAAGTDIKFDPGATFNLKGKDEAVDAFRPLDAKIVSTHSTVSIIGRESELSTLANAIECCNKASYARCVVIEAEAG